MLGRDHRLVKNEELGMLALESTDFAKQCVELYEELSEGTATQFPTPHVEESLGINEARGQLSTVAARLVMKLMWLARIARPDILYAVTQCAKQITKWTVQDDKRIARVVGYIKQTATFAPIIRIEDEPLHLSLYVDADFGGSAVSDQKSTSGFVLALEGDNSFALLGWGSRTQKVVSRSTTEAEFVSLSAALFSEPVHVRNYGRR